jgi:hypothetical protein
MLKVTEDLLEREANKLNAVPGQQLNNVITSHAGN